MTKTTFAETQLKALVDRIERLEEEKKTIAADIKEIYAQAKGNGFDVKILRKIISIRKMEAEERQEQEAMIDLYMAALGMQPSLFEDNEKDSIGTADSTETPIQPAPSNPPVAQAESEGGSDTPIAPPTPIQDDAEEYARAVDWARDAKNLSVYSLQMGVQVDYTKAASFIERMEREGIITAPLPNGKRQLVSSQAPEPDLGNIPPHMDRRPKQKPEYTAEQYLGAG